MDMNVLLRTGLILALSFAGILAYMLMFEDKYIYFPDRALQQTPADVGLPFEDHQFQTTDGVTLHGWYMPRPGARFTVLHFHGNAGNISHRLHLYRRWHGLGLSVFAFDYRGYGRSGGEPDEHGLYLDSQAAWFRLTGKQGIEPEHIILAGRSLGCAVAARLASEVKAAGLVLETPFTNIPDMAAYHYPWLPLRWLVRSRYDSLDSIGKVDVPVLLIDAKSDRIVPASMSRRIFSAITAPGTHVTLPGDHNDFDILSGSAYAQTWRTWLDSLKPPQKKHRTSKEK